MAQVHKSAEERRRDFIEAAVAVMRRKGMGQTTSRDIAREAGVSTGLLHHYFDSADELLATAFEEVVVADLDRVRATLATIEDPAVRLDLLIEVFAPEGDDWQYQVWLDVWSAAARHPALQAVSQRVNAQWQQLMADLFRDGVATGAFRCPDPHASAWRLLALLDAMALQAVAQQVDIPRATAHDWVRSAARAEAGLPPHAPPPTRIAAPD
ncbi:MAG TPA: TetR family transcriptional regulator C-terminal domain-containing protein [Candidatus Nanopelagicales bacterium]